MVASVQHMGKTGQLDWDLIQLRAIKFVNRWKKSGKTNEKSYAHGFVIEFLNVFGIDWLTAPGEMEHEMFDGYSDYIWYGKIIIEMKPKGADPGFRKAESQIKRYTQTLTEEQQPLLWMACDFENIRLWDRKADKEYTFVTSKLVKYRKFFAPIAGQGADAAVHHDKEGVNRLAAENMAKLHDELKKHGYSGQDLEIYLARLLFCLFANDTDIFDQNSFQTYIESSAENGHDLDARLTQLFQDLNEPIDKRVPNSYFTDQIDATHFKYINGGLFEKSIRRANFDRQMRQTLLNCIDFDWSQISPAIFGSMFQGVMDRDQRREIGAHYTSEENILKLINPLFMDNLRKEFESIKKNNKALATFQQKLSKLKFLDPACGCGNFLIIAYRELRRLELEVVKTMLGDKRTDYMATPVAGNLKVNVDQFYGIEIEEWPCQIALTGMWLMDHLMNLEATAIFERYEYRLPLKQSATIVHGNAFRIDWETIVPKDELSYIMGNPPFVGNHYMSQRQREDIVEFFSKNKTIDYVAGWFANAAKYIRGTTIRCAFVATNSITQGEQVAILWKPLLESGIFINYGISTFKWSNEARYKAAVHCVIVGFSYQQSEKNISPYLFEGPSIIIESRNKTLCDVPQIKKGNQPTDGGNLIIEAKDYDDFIKAEPNARPFIKRLIGSEEFINNKERYCLWLVDINPAELRKLPLVMERVEKCRQMRLNSSDPTTRRLSEMPTRFRETYNYQHYLVIPEVSSENRVYVPIGFMDSNTIPTNKLQVIPDATVYHLGLLTSNVHMAWTRAVCGRLKSDYQYSKQIVYNNFPWPEATDKQKAEIEKLAQSILDARANYPDSSLADLYDQHSMPPELLKAHKALDKAVMKLYGFTKDMSEPDIVARLMEMYQKLVSSES